MHKEAREYVRRYSSQEVQSIVEIGSRNINGTVRDFFNQSKYVGLDLHPGPCVDVVSDAFMWNPPDPVDLVLCCEVLEHAFDWQNLVLHACQWLKPNGRIVITCAGPGRAPHSAINGGPLQKGEWYANISPRDLAFVLNDAGIFTDSLEFVESSHDTRASGQLTQGPS